MISQLEGSILHADLRHIVIDVGGVGYKVWIGSDTLQRKARMSPEKVRIWTYLAVRETALDLYGFSNVEELEFFELLITISGIGPKTAATIMNVASVSTLRNAVISGDPSYLTKISGVGGKNAQKIVRELEGKLGVVEGEVTSTNVRNESDALEALKSLGYAEREARDALKKVPSDITSTGERVKKALKVLGGQ